MVRVYGHFGYSHWGMFRLAVIILPWWHAEMVADEEDIEEIPVQTAEEIADVLVATGMG